MMNDTLPRATPRVTFPSWPHWSPILAGPLTVVIIYIARHFGHLEWFSRVWQDDTILPYALTASAAVFALLRGLIWRNPLMLMLAAMAGACFYRELHWAFSSPLAYITLGVNIFIGRRWYDRIGPYLCRGRIAQWLVMTAATYVFAVALAKGWIQFLIPDDDFMRDYLEETCENVAHLMLLGTVLFAGWKIEPLDSAPFPPGERPGAE